MKCLCRRAHLTVLLDSLVDEFGESVVVDGVDELVGVDAVGLVHPQPHQLGRLLDRVAGRE